MRSSMLRDGKMAPESIWQFQTGMKGLSGSPLLQELSPLPVIRIRLPCQFAIQCNRPHSSVGPRLNSMSYYNIIQGIHTMAKPLKMGTVIQFPESANATPLYKGKASAKLLKKAKDAYSAARQRCHNPNHPSYGGYGALGIKMLFADVYHFIDDVGIPKSSDVSLDRINAHGHYEPGNVRWAKSKVQALNKKEGEYATHAPLHVLIHAAKAKAAAPNDRKLMRDAWKHAVTTMNRGYLGEDVRDWFDANRPDFKFSENGWLFGQARSFDEPESYFYLPSLTLPGQKAILIGGPFEGQKAPDLADGTIPALGYFPLKGYVPSIVLGWMNKDLHDETTRGAVWIGQTSPELLLSGGIEGWMLAIASKLSEKGSVNVCPVMTLIDKLKAAGHPYGWDDLESPILDCRYLFVPDLEIDAGKNMDISGLDRAQIATLIKYRAARGLQTYVGVANIEKLGINLQQTVLSSLQARKLPSKIFNVPKRIEAGGPMKNTNPYI